MKSEKKVQLFTPDYLQIPYQLLIDRELEQTDRMLYGLVYWYEHMKDGECRASNNTLGELLYTTTRVIQNSLNTLEKRGYIERDYKDDSKRNRLRIRGLIAFKNVPPRGDRRPASDIQVTNVPPIGDTQVPPIGDQNKNIYIKKKKENIPATQSVADEGALSLNKIMEEFEAVNPSFARLFPNKNQRAALDRLVKKYGDAKVIGAIRYAASIAGKPYAPSITTPYELEAKLGALVNYSKKEKARGPMLTVV
jgi:hypothetical protein